MLQYTLTVLNYTPLECKFPRSKLLHSTCGAVLKVRLVLRTCHVCIYVDQCVICMNAGWYSTHVDQYVLVLVLQSSCVHSCSACCIIYVGKLKQAFECCQVLNKKRLFEDVLPWQDLSLRVTEV